jgi:hypothetical protein
MSTIDELVALGRDGDPILRNALLLSVALGIPPLSNDDFKLRENLIRQTMAELTSAGVDAESLVRFGMQLRITGALVTLFLLETGNAADAAEAIATANLSRWRELLKLDDPVSFAPEGIKSREDLVRVSREHFTRARDPLRRWVEAGPIDEVLSLIAPSAEAFEEALGSTEAADEVRDRYRWAADRLVEGDFQRWQTSSLHLEHKWSEGKIPMLFVEGLFRAKVIDKPGLLAEIARRAVEDVNGGEGTQLLYQLQEQAKSFLKQGRHAEASALFSFYASYHEDEASAHNNFGFCLIPADPESALESLERARVRGFHRAGILAYNRACCMFLLSREGEALDLLEYYWQRERETNPDQATLWRPTAEAWEIYEELDIRVAVARLGEVIAAKIAPDRVPTWRGRQKGPSKGLLKAA